MRNLGVAFAHSVIAWSALLKGLGKMDVNQAALAADLDTNWEVSGNAFLAAVTAAAVVAVTAAGVAPAALYLNSFVPSFISIVETSIISLEQFSSQKQKSA